MTDSTDLLGQHLERVARREVATVDNGVAFEFGSANPSAAEIRKLEKRFEKVRDRIVDSDNKIVIVSMASSPGTADLNQELSNQRGDWLKTWLVDHGVNPNKITFRSRGELDPEIGDSAYNRIAFWRVEHIPEISAEVPSHLVEMMKERFHMVKSDREAGEKIFAKLFAPHADLMRQMHSLPENSIFPDSSADPIEFAKQAARLVADLALDLSPIPTSPEDAILDVSNVPVSAYKVAAKLMAGVFEGIARENLVGEVVARRRPTLNGYKQAIAAALDPNYSLNLSVLAPINRALVLALYNQLTGLPEDVRYQIALYFAEAHRAQLISAWGPPEVSDLERRLDGVSFAGGADFVFSESEYQYRSSHSGNHASSLTLVFGGGQIKVIDSAGREIGSAEIWNMERDAEAREKEAGKIDMQAEAHTASGTLFNTPGPAADQTQMGSGSMLLNEPEPVNEAPPVQPDEGTKWSMESDTAVRETEAGNVDMENEARAAPRELLVGSPSPAQTADTTKSLADQELSDGPSCSLADQELGDGPSGPLADQELGDDQRSSLADQEPGEVSSSFLADHELGDNYSDEESVPDPEPPPDEAPQ